MREWYLLRHARGHVVLAAGMWVLQVCHGSLSWSVWFSATELLVRLEDQHVSVRYVTRNGVGAREMPAAPVVKLLVMRRMSSLQQPVRFPRRKY